MSQLKQCSFCNDTLNNAYFRCKECGERCCIKLECRKLTQQGKCHKMVINLAMNFETEAEMVEFLHDLPEKWRKNTHVSIMEVAKKINKK
jgi:hypothetical protein